MAAHGITTGGTGPLVRPVVSCKGTTCQYGLIDTYDLSQKIHERFYREWPRLAQEYRDKLPDVTSPETWEKTFAPWSQD